MEKGGVATPLAGSEVEGGDCREGVCLEYSQH